MCGEVECMSIDSCWCRQTLHDWTIDVNTTFEDLYKLSLQALYIPPVPPNTYSAKRENEPYPTVKKQ